MAPPKARSSVMRLLELEVRVDDLLDHMLNLLIEREPNVLPRVHPAEGRVVVELFHHLAERHAVLGAEVEPKALVQLGIDAGQRGSVSSSSGAVSWPCFVLTGASTPGLLCRAILPLPVCWMR